MRLIVGERLRRNLFALLDAGVVLASFLSLASLIAEYGFYLDTRWMGWLHEGNGWILHFYLLQLMGKLLLSSPMVTHLKEHALEFSLGAVLAIVLLASVWGLPFLGDSKAEAELATRAYLVATQVLIGLFALFNFARVTQWLARLRIQPARLVAGSFLFGITVGAALLMLPRASHSGLSLTDAFFTSTSAVCVTGLSTIDVSAQLTGFGQAVLMGLIQMGGLGIMTLAGGMVILFGGLGGLRHQMLLRDILQPEGTARIRSLVWKIVCLTLVVESLGAFVLWHAWSGILPSDAERAWNAVFHAVSAFCNAGFSIQPGGIASTGFSTNVFGLLALMGLVVVGSAGFPAVMDLLGRLRSTRRRILLSTRIVLWATGVLLLGGAFLIWMLELNGAFCNATASQGVLGACMLSVMPRSAGLQNIDLALLGTPSLLLIMLLMFIGGAPGSTAGGVRLTTFVINLSAIRAMVRGETVPRLGKRELPQEQCLRAMTILILFSATALAATLLLAALEGIELLPAAFEIISALSTCGLSINLTPLLSVPAKWLVITCMFAGRLGLLALLWSLFHRERRGNIRYPEESPALF